AEDRAARRLAARRGRQDPALQAGRGGQRGQRARQRRRGLLILAHQGAEGLRALQLLGEAEQIFPVQRSQRVKRGQVLEVLRVQWTSPDRTGKACLNLFIPSR